MIEILYRERSEAVAKFELDTMMQGMFAGVSQKDMNAVLEVAKKEYRSRVFQTIFDASEMAKRLRGELGKIRQNQNYLKTLSNMAVN